MLRSMYTAISGLRNHQVMLDTVANNIANVNTYGFKSSEATFKDLDQPDHAGRRRTVCHPRRYQQPPDWFGYADRLDHPAAYAGCIADDWCAE